MITSVHKNFFKNKATIVNISKVWCKLNAISKYEEYALYFTVYYKNKL
jgi:hypothetical protein